MNNDVNNNIEQNAQVNPVPSAPVNTNPAPSAPVNTNPVPSAPVNTNPAPSAPVNDNPINNIDSGKPKKNNNGLLITLIIILLVIIGIVVFAVFNSPSGSNNSGGNDPTEKTSNDTDEKEVTCVSGKYANGNNKINVYCTTGKKIGSDKEEKVVAYTLNIQDESYSMGKGTAYFENNVAVDKEYSFKFEDGKLIYGNDKVVYEKVDEYTKEEYAKDNFNVNKELFDGKYNNSYKNGN